MVAIACGGPAGTPSVRIFTPAAITAGANLVVAGEPAQGPVVLDSSGVVDVGDVHATLDRVLHHSAVVAIRGDSYQLREKRRSGLMKAAHEQQNNG